MQTRGPLPQSKPGDTERRGKVAISMSTERPVTERPVAGATVSAELNALYEVRFATEADRRRKDAVWNVLCTNFFQRYVPADAVVLDVGAGLGEFLRHITCGQRIAVDIAPMVGRTLPPGSIEITASADEIASHMSAGSVDVVLCSNVFEHLPDTDTFLNSLRAILTVLRPGGRLLVLQPNIRAVGGAYWDFVDHHLALTDRTLVEAATMIGYDVEEIIPRFLPYTTRSRLPQSAWLVRAYLKFRPAWRLLGGQAWMVARKPHT